MKPRSNEIIDEENISNKPVLGKIAFQCPLVGCKSKLKNISSVIDHLNKVHRVPRGLYLRYMVKSAQKNICFCKREEIK